VAKDASKPAVSWLNFEPRVSKFPVIGMAMPFQSLLLRGNSFLFAIIRCVHNGDRNGIYDL
ncbi:hypothetical protein, partial [Granulicatella elegans]|uniref:hypothetical protein n=1 Tax=Granulicatella elegans TaxID=137732 RepID=UPI0028D24E5F